MSLFRNIRRALGRLVSGRGISAESIRSARYSLNASMPRLVRFTGNMEQAADALVYTAKNLKLSPYRQTIESIEDLPGSEIIRNTSKLQIVCYNLATEAGVIIRDLHRVSIPSANAMRSVQNAVLKVYELNERAWLVGRNLMNILNDPTQFKPHSRGDRCIS